MSEEVCLISLALENLLIMVIIQIISLVFYVSVNLFVKKDKDTAKEVGKNLGIYLAGSAQALLIVFLFWMCR